MFFERLSALCADKGESVTSVIVKLGFSRGNIDRWRDGSSPTGDTLLKFADYFGVTTDYLLRRQPAIDSVRTPQEIAKIVEFEIEKQDTPAKRLLIVSGMNKYLIADMRSGIMPSIEEIVAMAKYLDTSVDYLLGITDDPTPPTISDNERNKGKSDVDEIAAALSKIFVDAGKMRPGEDLPDELLDWAFGLIRQAIALDKGVESK